MLERNFRRRLDAHELRGEDDRIGGRRRLVVGDVENPGGPAREGGIDRLGDVADMDAVEDLARLDDAAGFAARDLDQRVLPGSVNAGEAQDRDRDAAARAKIQPGLLGGEPLAAARRARLRRRCLVDPGAAAVAINADGREIDDCAQPLRVRQNIAAGAQHRIAVLVGRN